MPAADTTFSWGVEVASRLQISRSEKGQFGPRVMGSVSLTHLKKQDLLVNARRSF